MASPYKGMLLESSFPTWKAPLGVNSCLCTVFPKSFEELCDIRRSSLGGSLSSANVSMLLPRATFQVFLSFAAVEFVFLL